MAIYYVAGGACCSRSSSTRSTSTPVSNLGSNLRARWQKARPKECTLYILLLLLLLTLLLSAVLQERLHLATPLFLALAKDVTGLVTGVDVRPALTSAWATGRYPRSATK